MSKVMTTATTVTIPVDLKIKSSEYIEGEREKTHESWSFSRLVTLALTDYLNKKEK